MAVTFARPNSMASSSIYRKIDIHQLINSCSLCASTDKTQTTNAASCRSLSYAARLRGSVAGRNSHDVSRHEIKNSKKMGVFSEALITPAEGLS